MTPSSKAQDVTAVQRGVLLIRRRVIEDMRRIVTGKRGAAAMGSDRNLLSRERS
jgi:hypothetical protein